MRPGTGEAQRQPEAAEKHREKILSSSSAATNRPSLFLFLWRADVPPPSSRNIAATTSGLLLRNALETVEFI
jgi:hypothetical protein